jgi:hypothetical protein
MANRRVGGIIFIKVDGSLLNAKGEFTYNLGIPKRTGVVGQDATHGFSEVPQIAYIEGTITDTDELDVESLLETRDATVTLELANGKTIVLSEAYYAADGAVTTAEGEIEARFEGIRAEELSP